MSDFVDYNKRDITLPFGCKDLAEVLARKAPSCQTELKCEKLSAIGEYISRAWASAAEGITLCVSSGKQVDPGQDAGLRFTLQRIPDDGLIADVQVRMGTKDETALRLFLERHGYSLTDTSVPAQFNQNFPIEVIWHVSPFPGSPSELAALATAVFRQVCKLADDSEVTLCYQEIPNCQ